MKPSADHRGKSSNPRRLFLATGNAHKIAELSTILRAAGLEIEVLPPAAIGGMPLVVEDGATFEANAERKARTLAARAPRGAWVVADDSGLAVDALSGAPGVMSARFAGPDADDAANNARLLTLLREVDETRRTAAFHCCVVLVSAPNGPAVAFHGRCPGRLLLQPRGAGGFGYDPLFVPDGWNETFAELSAEIKNRISHRARALRELVDWLRRDPPRQRDD